MVNAVPCAVRTAQAIGTLREVGGEPRGRVGREAAGGERREHGGGAGPCAHQCAAAVFSPYGAAPTIAAMIENTSW